MLKSELIRQLEEVEGDPEVKMEWQEPYKYEPATVQENVTEVLYSVADKCIIIV